METGIISHNIHILLRSMGLDFAFCSLISSSFLPEFLGIVICTC
jgi:hypothetical protein